ncbi:MAG: SH3 domain-containing protein, partial [Lachnospiraceae bacterium]|nr:SH3 domain-containing protein [Lachnospiraceae bacterium]
GPGTDYDRLGSAYKGFDYEVLSTDNSEWVKIKYDDKAAYIFAEYVEIVPMVLNDMGEYEEYVDMNNTDSTDTSTTDDTSADTNTDDGEQKDDN